VSRSHRGQDRVLPQEPDLQLTYERLISP
jgi:hypothetical protein